MIEGQLRTLIDEAIRGAREAGDLDVAEHPGYDLTKPPRREHGDWSANVALVLQKAAGRKPRELADELIRHLSSRDWLLKVEVAGPGFINFFVSASWLHETVRRALDEGDRFGAAEPASGQRVNVEFVSANPTGPLHVGAARNAVLGDSIARLLAFTGDEVTREYYFNDAGRQMDNFGLSVAARYLEVAGRDVTFPDDGYPGEYVYDLARQILEEDGPPDGDASVDGLRDRMRERAYPIMLGWIEATLERFGVAFDVWAKEREFYESGKVAEVIDRLRASGHVEEAEGAVWLRSGDLGDDRDRRVLVKSDGSYTYLAGDLAYHAEKASRSDHMIDVWGADHHGQVASLVAGLHALGVDPSRIEVILYQLVLLTRGGEPQRMGRRAGNFVTLEELIDEVGADAARYTLLATAGDHDIRFDIDEVSKRTLENPVYYVQYGHARIASILRNASEQGIDVESGADLSMLEHEAEDELMRAIAQWPETVSGAAATRAPSKVARYAEELARRFHKFYTDCRVLTDDEPLTLARLALCMATMSTVKAALGLLGVSAPDRMEWVQ